MQLINMESANEEDNNAPPLMVEAVGGGANARVDNAAELMDEVGVCDHEEDDESESDDDDEDWQDLDEDIMRRLKNNDPNIDTVGVIFSPDDEDVFDATTFDWEKDGVAIAENTHLKKLYTDDWHHEDETQLANAKAFCNALSKNRSIEHYSMSGWPLGVEDTCSILSPFFEHNTNLRSFELHHAMDVTTLPIFTSALAKCKSLRKIGLLCRGMEDELAAELVASLSTHHNLKKLTLYASDSSGKQWCIALGNLLQNPESKLEKLSFNHNNINDEVAAVLGDVLGNGSKLKKLSLISVKTITSPGWVALFRGLLTNTNSSLEELDISYSKGIDDKALLTFAAEYAIARNRSLKTLEFASCSTEQISTSIWGTLFRSLFNPVSLLEKLDLTEHNINDEGLEVLGNVLGNNSTLKVLNLGSCRNITSAGWVAFFRGVSDSQTSVLQEFRGPSNNIDDAGLAAFANVVLNNPKLKIIYLYSNPSISAAGWQTFFTSLHNCDTLLLEELYLWSNNINDAAVISMVDALNGIESLTCLDVANNPSISSTGWIALSALLQHPNSSLSVLTLTNHGVNTINDEVVASYANALLNNKSITTLAFGCDYGSARNNITARGWDALANVLCNKASIESIYASNHTLCEVGYWSSDSSNRPTNLLSLVSLNKDKNKSEVARQKIVQYHFTNDGKIEDFVDMDVYVIPHAICWIGRVSSLHSLLYNVVRGMPTLFDSDAKAKAAAAGIKRKIGCC